MSVDGSAVLNENALEGRDEHLGIGGLMDELAGSTGALKLVVAAVDDERDIALFQFCAHVRRRESVVKSVVDDSCGEVGKLRLHYRVLERAGDDDLRPGMLETLGDI